MMTELTDEMGNRRRFPADAEFTLGKNIITAWDVRPNMTVTRDGVLYKRSRAECERCGRLETATVQGKLTEAFTRPYSAPKAPPTVQAQPTDVGAGRNAPKGSVTFNVTPMGEFVRVMWDITLPGRSDKATRRVAHMIRFSLVAAEGHEHEQNGMLWFDLTVAQWRDAHVEIGNVMGSFGVETRIH